MTELDEPREQKRKYPRADAIAVAREMVGMLQPCCARLIVAGSLRRRKALVGDVELLFIANTVTGPDPEDLFGKSIVRNAVDVALGKMLKRGVIEQRLSRRGSPAWGLQNKLATHVASGIPVDLFYARPESWWNLLVARTGPLQSNIRICQAAIEGGWKWNPYGDGFSRPNPERNGWLLIAPMHSEQEVFEFVNLPYLEPWERK
jgi:DNA polymerase/3'-5' exonuclease PolX